MNTISPQPVESVDGAHGSLKTVQCNLACKTVALTLDLGAKVSILNKRTGQQVVGKNSLEGSNQKSYNCEPL